MSHLLVTNDFPPKIGGIQRYLWDLWRHMPCKSVAVLTTPHPDADTFDAAAPFRIERTPERWLLPTKSLAARIDALADEVGSDLVVLDPALPLGAVGPKLRHPYAVVVHGAETAIPGRMPFTSGLLAKVLRSAKGVVAGSEYPAEEVRSLLGPHAPPLCVIPPAVDTGRWHPTDLADHRAIRAELDIAATGPLIVGMSRLVPRKGMDTLIEAGALVARHDSTVTVVIAGAGRDEPRLRALAWKVGCPTAFVGRLSEVQLPRLVAAADVFAMLCRDRWLGMEKEGYGIVFVEAAACGVPVVAGNSGGACEAVVDGETGTVVLRPSDAHEVAAAIMDLLMDQEGARAMGQAGRLRAITEFNPSTVASRLHNFLTALERHG